MYISGNRRSAILALLIVLLVFGSPTPAGIDAAQSSRFTSAAEPETIPGVEIPVIAVPGDGQQSYVAPPAALG